MSKKTTSKRINFATSRILDYPDLLEVQLRSFKDFFQLETTPENRKEEGLYQVFKEIFPIEDTRNNSKSAWTEDSPTTYRSRPSCAFPAPIPNMRISTR